MADGDTELQPLLQRAAELALPAIVLGEFQYGTRQSRYRARYERWNDIWIAALARQHAMAVISRDQHFDAVPGLKRVGW